LKSILVLLLSVVGCSVDGNHDVEVSGGTTNKVEFFDSFCDPRLYTTIPEQRQCKDALLAAMKCKGTK